MQTIVRQGNWTRATANLEFNDDLLDDLTEQQLRDITAEVDLGQLDTA